MVEGGHVNTLHWPEGEDNETDSVPDMPIILDPDKRFIGPSAPLMTEL